MHTTTALDPSSDLLRAALAYGEQGFQVFPLLPRDKRPYPGTRGFLEATADPALIQALWTNAPASNIGVRPPEGVIVVDVDPRSGGDASIVALEAQHGPLPDTLTARTGGGGLHAFFRVPEGLTWPARLAEGVDVKSSAGYVVAAPSVHESGGVYEWIDVSPIADAPPWLVAKGRPKGERAAVIDEDEGLSRSAAEIAQAVALLEPLFVKGKKHAIAYALGGWFRQRKWNSADVARVVEQLPSDKPRARVKDALAGYRANQGWHGLKAAIGDAAAAALDAGIASAYRDEQADLDAARALIPVASAVHPAPAAGLPGPVPGAPHPAPANDAPAPTTPVIIGDARGSQFWVLRGADYYAPVSKSMLPARYLEATGGKGGKQKAEDLAAGAVIAERVVRDFAATGITWHAEERAVVHGYELPKFEPVYDAQVDAWLRALASERYGYLAQWFAACEQQQIRKLAACLILVGGTGIGKTLIGIVAARMWGASSPVPLGHAIDKFNSTITRCPIVLDDEAARMKQADVPTCDFREMLSSRERTYEPKGVDKRELRGCQRFVITANSFSDLRFSDVGALEVVEALADRLLVVRCGPADAVRAALEPLRLPGTDDVDLTRLDRHVAWLVGTTPVTKARFLASPGKTDYEARRAVLDGLLERYPDLFDQVRAAIARGEHAAPVDPPAVFVAGGLVWVRGERAVAPPLTSRDAYRAMGPWEVEPRRDLVKVAGGVVRARAYDLDRLLREVAPVTPVTVFPHSPQV